MKNFLVYFVIFVPIWLLVALLVEIGFYLYGIDPETQEWANYLLIAVAACTASILTPLVQKKITKK